MDWLKEIRAEVKLTQEDVANRVGIARASYTKIELGIRRPSPEVAKKIAGAMGFDWTRFYDEEPAVEPEGR